VELVSAAEPTVLAIGEAMIELSGADLRAPALGFAGDVLNTAIGLARLGVGVGFATALGDDPFSAELLSMVGDEGVGTSAIATVPGGLPGLYAIRTDADGERRFYYWRRDSAARRMLDSGRDAALGAAVSAARHVYLSGITLAILPDAARQALFALLDRARDAGTTILFDGNYRPALWGDPGEARAATAALLARTAIALPTFQDEQALFGDRTAEAVAARLHGLGVAEVVVKDGVRGCFVSAPGSSRWVDVPVAVAPVDTSGAGDAFNAGYLAARLAGRPPADAALAGHRMAAVTLAHAGAIPPRGAVKPDLVLA
jgi:2-dehydro-3-deoxygluconokinase